MRAFNKFEVWRNDQERAVDTAMLVTKYTKDHPTLTPKIIMKFIRFRERLIESSLLKKNGIGYINQEIDRMVEMVVAFVEIDVLEKSNDSLTWYFDHIEKLVKGFENDIIS